MLASNTKPDSLLDREVVFASDRLCAAERLDSKVDPRSPHQNADKVGRIPVLASSFSTYVLLYTANLSIITTNMPPRRSKEQKAAELAAASGSTMTVTAQQSRFHTEMDEDNNLKEVCRTHEPQSLTH